MRHPVLALLLAMALLSAACTSTVAGAPVKASGPQSAVDFDRLSVGPFPTTPREPLGVAGDRLRGVVLEAQRMANHVVGAWEVDPALTKAFGFGAMVLPAVEALNLIGPGELAAAAGRHNFVNGFAAARTQERQKLLLNAVFRFADDAAAAAATTDLAETAMQQRGADGPAQKVSIPDHPEAQANSFTSSDRQAGQFNAVRSFTAHGPYVLMQLAQSTESVEQATDLVARTLDRQGPAIDEFRATDVSEFADITIDPTGLLARTIPAEGQTVSFTQNSTYERRGALHFQSDPTRSAKLFADTGTDLVAMGRANVYEAEDAGGATGIVEGFSDELSPTSRPANAVPNLPGSRCLRLADSAFYCLASADRYAIEVSGPELLSTQQLVAAQYVMLMSG